MGEKETPPAGSTGGQTSSTGGQTGSTGGQTGGTGGQTGSTGGEGTGGPMTGTQEQPHPQLTWDDARKEMFKDMTHEQQNQFWQIMDNSEQDRLVQEWHQEHFGLPTSTARGQH